MRCLMVTLIVGWLASNASAQTPGAAVVTGKITAVEAKGKTTTLKLQDDGGTEHSYLVTPAIDVQIQSQGGDDCLAPGLFVQIDTIQSNKAFFGSQFLIYPDQAGKIPPAKAIKAPAAAGQSRERYFVSGEIVRYEKVEDGKYNLLHLKVNPKVEFTVYIEPNHNVKVVRSDLQAAEIGQTATVEGRAAGAKLIPSKITIDTGAKVTGEELLAGRKEKK
jgi:hypothetical protein